jgi:hypothetical protein
VTSPTEGAQVALGIGADPLALTVSYTVTGFTLSMPGTCGVNLATCGHVHIAIDGAGCNGPGRPYNNSGFSGNDFALFEYCLVNTGPHRIHLDLHNDLHALIPGSPSQDVDVVTTAATASPAVTIADPKPGSLVAIGGDPAGSVPVMATASNFQLAAPGTCTTSACGQIRFFVNGSACNTGGGFNAIDPSASGPVDPALLPFASCRASDAGYDTTAGAYVITAQLFDDRGVAVDGGQSAPVQVTVLAP